MEKLATLNNFENIIDLQKFIISNANYKFLEELNITEENAIIFISKNAKVSNQNLSKGQNIDLVNEKLQNNFSKEIQNQINQKSKNKAEELIKNAVESQVEDQLEQQVEDQLEQQVEEQIYESLKDYFDRLEEEYKSKGWTVCSRTEDSISASSSSDGCDYQ